MAVMVVESTSTELITLQQLVQLPTLLLRELHEHGVKQSAVNDSADMPDQLVGRAESGQLKALPHQLLHGHVDQVGRVVHYLGGGIGAASDASGCRPEDLMCTAVSMKHL
jgi:hypothetical protein